MHEHALAHLLLMSEPILSSDIAIAGSHGIINPQCDGFDANTSTFYTDSTCYYGLSNLSTNLGAASASINCFAQNASSIVGSPWLIAGYSTNATNITDTTHHSETLVVTDFIPWHPLVGPPHSCPNDGTHDAYEYRRLL